MLGDTNQLLIAILITAIVMGCNDASAETKQSSSAANLKSIKASAWTGLAQEKIYFGHQSVGSNIIEGVEGLMTTNPQIKLKITKINKPSDFNNNNFAHSFIGKNFKPESKIKAFADYINKGIGDNVGIALFKFCHVDIARKTDIKKIYNDYKNTLTGLKASFPKTTFVHVTTPLTCEPAGFKGWIKQLKDMIKRIIGKRYFNDYDNIKRNQLNEMIRQNYQGKEPIFDLAKILSTFPNGKRSSFKYKGKTYYSLVPDYTNDGWHLNKNGARVSAEKLLLLLTNLSQ